MPVTTEDDGSEKERCRAGTPAVTLNSIARRRVPADGMETCSLRNRGDLLCGTDRCGAGVRPRKGRLQSISECHRGDTRVGMRSGVHRGQLRLAGSGIHDGAWRAVRHPGLSLLLDWRYSGTAGGCFLAAPGLQAER